MLGRTDLVVSMGGYNTATEIRTYRKAALLVPRQHPRRAEGQAKNEGVGKLAIHLFRLPAPLGDLEILFRRLPALPVLTEWEDARLRLGFRDFLERYQYGAFANTGGRSEQFNLTFLTDSGNSC
jgi:predicted glycosyltransferase